MKMILKIRREQPAIPNLNALIMFKVLMNLYDNAISNNPNHPPNINNVNANIR